MFSPCLILPLIATLIVPSMGASVLGSLDETNIGLITGQGVLPPQLPLFVSLNGDPLAVSCFSTSPSSPFCVTAFNQTLTPSDVGSTFVFDSSSPGFAAAVTFLTNGSDYVWTFNVFGTGGGEVTVPGAGQQFSAGAVQEIDLTLNSLTFSQVQLPTSLTTLGTFTQSAANLTITFQGTEVPEPSSTSLIAIALLAGLGVGRRVKG